MMLKWKLFGGMTYDLWVVSFFRLIHIRLPHYALGQRWDLKRDCENQRIAMDRRDSHCRLQKEKSMLEREKPATNIFLRIVFFNSLRL